MHIDELYIENIGGITKLNLKFNNKMNIICGPNSIGKTTILECFAHSFISTNTNILRKKASTKNGSFRYKTINNKQTIENQISIRDFNPMKETFINSMSQYSNKLLSLKVHRTFNYENLIAVAKDVSKDEYQLGNESINGINLYEIKNWFVNRFLYSVHEGSLTKEQIANYELAKSCFSAIDSDFEFSTVKGADNEIMVNTPNGEIYYEYLSSGFKSLISILFGIIKDIEFRFKNPCIKAKDFDGIILIDELELHLHPIWQSKVCNILTEIFPNAQFITSTHSPHIIQNANPNEIIALGRKENKEVIQIVNMDIKGGA